MRTYDQLSMYNDYPVLTLKERDRRWNRTRELLTRQGLKCLLIAGFSGREQYDAYLTNDYAEGLVIFPANDAPIYITWAPSRVARQQEEARRGITPWVEDMRVGLDANTISAIIREKGCDEARVGVVGLQTKGPSEISGIIPYQFWAATLKELPLVEFVECSTEFSTMMLVKSEEELILMRHSAAIGEEACRVMFEQAKPGITERELTAQILYTIFSAGAFSPAPFLILHSGPTSESWGPSLWRYRGGKSRVLEKGDMVMAEIFPRYGGFESQQQMAVALEPVDATHEECANIARRCYEVGLEKLRPGATFQEVTNAMEAVIEGAGCWHLTPLIHSLCPLAWVGHGKAWKGADLTIKTGMVFELEPNAHKGNHRVNIGGTVIVTDGRAEELNDLSTRMRIIG
jgi:Xaa-Pro dipeptidase